MHTQNHAEKCIVNSGTPVLVRLIERPSDSQIEEIVSLLLRAFEGDTSLKSMTGGREDLAPSLFRVMLRSGALEGSLYIVTDVDVNNESRIASVALWSGPGEKMLASEAQRKEGFNDWFAALEPDLQDWWTKTYLEISEKMLYDALGEGYLGSWFADIIATDPKCQRKGYATALVKTICGKAEKEGKSVGIATQTERNTAWYGRLGFKIVGQCNIPAPTGNWTAYAMAYNGE